MNQSCPDSLPESLHRQIHSFRHQLRVVRMLDALYLCSITIALSYLLLFLSDRIWETPLSFLWTCCLIAGIGMITFIPFFALKWIWRYQYTKQIAKLIEHGNPQLGDQLLSILEINTSSSIDTSSITLRIAAREQMAEAIANIDLSQYLPKSHNRLYGSILGILIFFIVCLSIFVPDATVNTWLRFISPNNPPKRFTLTQLDYHQVQKIIPLGEPTTLDIPLLTSTRKRPLQAQFKLSSSPWIDVSLNQQTHSYSLEIPSVYQKDTLEFSAGDARQTIQLIPESRPSLERAFAIITPPAYTGKQPYTEELKAGTITALYNSTVQIHAISTKELESATTVDNQPIDYLKKTVTLPSITVKNEAHAWKLNWRDIHHLVNSSPIHLSLTPIEDQNPQIHVRAQQNTAFLLEETSLELDLEANDDYGVNELGIEWVSEKDLSKNKDTPSINSLPPPPSSHKIVKQGNNNDTSLKSRFVFQAKSLGITPQRIVLRGFAKDYFPNRPNIYSQPLVIRILSHAEHAQMIRTCMDRVEGELDEIAKTMDSMEDEIQLIRKLEHHEFANDNTTERLNALSNIELTNRRKIETLIQFSQQLFLQGTKNSEIDPDSLQQFINAIQSLKKIPQEIAQQAQTYLKNAAQANDPEKREKALTKGESKHLEATETLRKAMSQLNKSAQEMESSTFVARLRQASRKEKSISESLASKLPQLAGLFSNELSQTLNRELDALYALQQAVSKDVSWITEDLKFYKSRTEEAIYSDLYTQMLTLPISEKMMQISTSIKNTHVGIAIEKSDQIANILEKWATLIDDYKKNHHSQESSSSGSGGDSQEKDETMSESDFELMLKMIRMIQQQQDIRIRTRAVEQERRTSTAS
ncbi:MAG: hypothetical protein RSF35_00290 [Akkermansia sp.]